MELVKTISNNKVIKIFLISLVGSILLTVSAKIKIPFYPVPMTMQTFVVLFLGISFGYKVGVTAVFLYLLEGIAGLPVFSGTPEKGIGFLYFTGPTMGYLIGFLVSVYLAGFFKYDKNLIKNSIKLIFSVSFIYIMGLIWLGTLIGWDKPIFTLGAKPFLLAELFKVLLLVFLTPTLLKAKKFIKTI